MSKKYSVLSDVEVKIKNMKTESVEEFLARGGKVTDVASEKSSKKKGKNKIDAQKLLDAAIGTEHEAEVVKFLASQGIDVE